MQKLFFIIPGFLLAIEHILMPWTAPLLTFYACIIIQITRGGRTSRAESQDPMVRGNSLKITLLMGIFEDILQVTYPPGTYTTMFIATYCLVELVTQIAPIHTLFSTMITLALTGFITIAAPAVITFWKASENIFLTDITVVADVLLLLLPYLIIRDMFYSHDPGVMSQESKT